MCVRGKGLKDFNLANCKGTLKGYIIHLYSDGFYSGLLIYFESL